MLSNASPVSDVNEQNSLSAHVSEFLSVTNAFNFKKLDVV